MVQHDKLLKIYENEIITPSLTYLLTTAIWSFVIYVPVNPNSSKVRSLQLSKNRSSASVEYFQSQLKHILVKEFGENFVKISNNSSPILSFPFA